jgi:hypothetical protein
MKKQIFRKVIIALLVVMVLPSCEDFLEIPPRGEQDMEFYFKTKDDLDAFITFIYTCSTQGRSWWQVASPRSALQMSTDDGWMGNTQQGTGDYYPSAFFTLSPIDIGHLFHDYRERYKHIFNCTKGIERAVEVENISENDRNQFIAECYFFRALNYYHLVNMHGYIPVITEELSTDELTLTNDAANQPELVWDQIIKDLNQAKLLLESNQAKGVRISYFVVEAYLARMYLFMERWQDSYTAANNVIENGPYSLTPNFVDIYSCDNRNGVESILEAQTIAGLRPNKAGNIFSMVMGGRGESADPITIDGVEVPSFISGSSVLKDGWARGGAPTSDLENAYLSENDSIRMGCTIIKYGVPVYGDEVEVPHYNFSLSQNKSGRCCRKYYVTVDWRKTFTDSDDAPLPVIDMRLGETYMTRAEAAYMLTNEGQALIDINTLRDRVELDPITGLSGSALLRQIWKERRLELAFEGLRYYDMRREIEPDGPNAGLPVITSIMGPNGTFVQYNKTSTDPFETGNLTEPQDKGSNFQWPKNQYVPIPQREIDNSDGYIKQSPGWQ